MNNHEFESAWEEMDEGADAGIISMPVVIETPLGVIFPVTDVFYDEHEGRVVIRSEAQE